jgi:hypothetical protein
MLLTRGVLYTAITRARELFIVVGDEGKVVQWSTTTGSSGAIPACGPGCPRPN